MSLEELKKLLKSLESRRALLDLSVEEQRARMEGMKHFKLADDVRCQAVDAADIPAEWITTPDAMEERVIYYLHGGGYVSGSINTHREMVSRLSRAARARAIIINYRLAPENPFPAAVDDAVTAYRWLLATGVNPRRLVIAGDSAGGGLAIATLTALRDNGEPLPAAGVCLSPWVNLEGLDEPTTADVGDDPIVSRENNRKMARAYLGNMDPRTPLASPLYADLTGLPPLLIQVGTKEMLLDDVTHFAERAQTAGVDVVLELWDNTIHTWHIFAAVLSEGQQAIDHIGEYVQEQTK